MSDTKTEIVKVWDILIRLFHWSLVFFFALAYVTEDDLLDIHIYAGYMIFILLIFRLLWGVIGSKYARFSHFLASPKEAVKYLKEEFSGDAKHYLGHNPAGAVMIVALIVSLFISTLSGVVVIATDGQGPLANTFVSLWPEGILEEVHEFFSHLSLLLVLLHIAGVIFSSLLQEENLVKAMITGKKNNPKLPQSQKKESHHE